MPTNRLSVVCENGPCRPGKKNHVKCIGSVALLHTGRSNRHPRHRKTSTRGPLRKQTIYIGGRNMAFNHIARHRSSVTCRQIVRDACYQLSCAEV